MGSAVSYAKPARAKWLLVRKADDVFDVLCPDGTIYGTYATLCQAAATVGVRQKEADQAARRVTRACMCCAKPFDSEGIHNRLCRTCRYHNSDGWNPHGIAPRSGRPK